MTPTVQLTIPNTGKVLEGVLLGLDKSPLRLTARLEQGTEPLRANMLAQATLIVGGVPRQLTVQVIPTDAYTAVLVPVSSATLSERRLRKRYPVNLLAQVRVDGQELTARVVNISASGIGMQIPYALAVGQEIEVSLPLVGADAPVEAQAQVRHARPLSNEMWYIGAAFTVLSRTDALLLRKLFP